MEKKTKKPAISNHQSTVIVIKKVDELPNESKRLAENGHAEKGSNPFRHWLIPPQRTSYIKAKEHDFF